MIFSSIRQASHPVIGLCSKSTLILFLLVILHAAVACAAPISYNINFTLKPGSTVLPSSGSFRYDQDTGLFSDFIVVFYGTSYDLTSSANSPWRYPTTGGDCDQSNYNFIFNQQGCLTPFGNPFSEARWWGDIKANNAPQTSLSGFGFVQLSGIDPGPDSFIHAIRIEQLLTITYLGSEQLFSGGAWTVSPAQGATDPIPEPTTVGLFALGLVGAYWRRRHCSNP